MTAAHHAGRDAFWQDNWRPAPPQPEDAMTARWPPVSGTVVPLGVLEAVTRALASVLATADTPPDQTPGSAADSQLIDVEQTAELLQVSRMTVIRMADEGRLPAIIIRKGRVQKIRRIPRAFVERMVADVAAGQRVDIDTYAAAWLAENGPGQEPESAGGAA